MADNRMMGGKVVRTSLVRQIGVIFGRQDESSPQNSTLPKAYSNPPINLPPQTDIC
jgi:hypothetical protein